jgi:3-oxoadipate enol-lactonase
MQRSPTRQRPYSERMLLAHDDDGSGPPVLLLHSGVCDRRMWDPIAPALSHTFRVVRPDLRGFGDSPLPGEEYADADDLDTLLDSIGVSDVAVVGSSMGGRVALELAVRHPGRVSSLVLLCPAWRGLGPDDPALEAFGAEEDRLLEAGELAAAVDLNVRTFLGPEVPAATRESVATMQRRAFEVQLAAAAQQPEPVQERVDVEPADIAVPTTVVCGGRDFAHFRAVGSALAQRIPGADLVDLPWAGHLPSLERPDAVLALLLDVLRHDPTVHAP